MLIEGSLRVTLGVVGESAAVLVTCPVDAHGGGVTWCGYCMLHLVFESAPHCKQLPMYQKSLRLSAMWINCNKMLVAGEKMYVVLLTDPTECLPDRS